MYSEERRGEREGRREGEKRLTMHTSVQCERHLEAAKNTLAHKMMYLESVDDVRDVLLCALQDRANLDWAKFIT